MSENELRPRDGLVWRCDELEAHVRELRQTLVAAEARCREQAEQLTAKDAEIERLRAVVAKLPKTADGVPVVPGMSVYQCHGELRRQVILACENWGNLPQEDANLSLFFEHCYSTQETAEAAKEASDATTN